MIIYDYRCRAGHRFEATVPSMFSDDPACECGESANRVPSAVRQLGADPGPSRDDMPNTWRGIRGGDPELVRSWHQKMTRREKLEEKHPELAGDRRPVLAHEGAFAGAPLRSGDPLVQKVAQATFGTRPAETRDGTTTAAGTSRTKES